MTDDRRDWEEEYEQQYTSYYVPANSFHVQQQFIGWDNVSRLEIQDVEEVSSPHYELQIREYDEDWEEVKTATQDSIHLARALHNGSATPTGTVQHRITTHDGGVAGDIVADLNGLVFRCCQTDHTIGTDADVVGYKREEQGPGYEDDAGNIWWLYVKCPQCGYDASVESNLDAYLPDHDVDDYPQTLAGF
jgi:hypothetical protein